MVAVGGAAISAALNVVTWLPVDVSGLMSVTVLVFIGVFPVWLIVTSLVVREQRLLRAANAPAAAWRGGVTWRVLFAGAPRAGLVVLAVVAAFVYITFFASIAQLPGQPMAVGGTYYFSNHGARIPTDLAGYLQGLRVQMRLFTGHPVVFYGAAALAIYARWRQPFALQTRRDVG